MVVLVLMAAWSLPATGMAATESRSLPPAQTIPAGTGRIPIAIPTVPATETGRYAEREKQAGALEDFEGGAAYIYIGGGALTVVLIILLIVILV
jgi:hypothetical protein